MEIINEKTNSTTQIEFSGSVLELLNHLKINPETVLVTKDDEVLVENEILQDTDKITILSVVSGG